MVFPYCRGFLYSRQDGVPWAVSYPPCLEGLRGQLPVLESQAGGNGCVFYYFCSPAGLDGLESRVCACPCSWPLCARSGENAQSPAGVRSMDVVVCFKHVRLSRGNRLLCLPDTRRIHELCVDRMPDRMVHEYLQNQVGEADNLPSMGPVLRMSDLWDFLRCL